MTRFLKNWETYCASVITEAELREQGKVLDVDAFVALRRENSAVRLCFSLIEYCFGIDLPDEVFEHPIFLEIYWAAADLVCWSNVRLLSNSQGVTKLLTAFCSRIYTHTTWSKAEESAETTLLRSL